MSFELPNSRLKLKLQHITIAIYDITFMVGTACVSFLCHFGCEVFVIRLLYRTFKEKLKIQEHHVFKLGFRFTMYNDCLLKCNEIWYKLKQEWMSK